MSKFDLDVLKGLFSSYLCEGLDDSDELEGGFFSDKQHILI